MQPVKLGKRHRLDDVETLALAILQKEFHLFNRQAVKDFPIRIGQPEEWRPFLSQESDDSHSQ